MRFDVITLLPSMFDALQYGVTGRAIQSGLVKLALWNPRDYTQDIHKTVDGRPYGGGPGMVLLYQPLAAAIRAAKQVAPTSKVVYLSPQGLPFKQHTAQAVIDTDGLILLAGRYEGIDERVVKDLVDEEWSIGDYVLSGGELPAMLIIDSVVRLLPGALGHMDSAKQDSFSQSGLLDCPHYTRPEVINEHAVPEVLLSGNHEKIRQWRFAQMIERTQKRRPELLAK